MVELYNIQFDKLAKNKGDQSSGSLKGKHWTDEIERRSRSVQLTTRKAGRENWASLAIEQKFTLLREVANTRSAEFCLAYKNLVDVTVGHKARGASTTSAGNKRSRTGKSPKPCLVFFVKRKQTEDKISQVHQNLPKEIWAYAHVIDEDQKIVRIPCLLPTDVRSISELKRIKASSYSQVEDKNSSYTEFGNATCRIKFQSKFPVDEQEQEKDGILSCRHLFSLTKVNDFTLYPGLKIYQGLSTDDADEYARTTAHAGDMTTYEDLSHDAQLARITNLSKNILKKALQELTFHDGYAEDFNEIPKESKYYIQVPKLGNRTTPIKAKYQADIINKPLVEYATPNGDIKTTHLILIESDADRIVKSGDSGSPVTTSASGGKLLGMHIAGDGDYLSYMIPAWILFNPARYKNLRSIRLIKSWQGE